MSITATVPRSQGTTFDDCPECNELLPGLHHYRGDIIHVPSSKFLETGELYETDEHGDRRGFLHLQARPVHHARYHTQVPACGSSFHGGCQD